MLAHHESGKRARLKYWLIAALIAVFGIPAWAQAERDLMADPGGWLNDPVNNALGRQHYHDMWLFLAESETTWIRTAAALHFIRASNPDLFIRTSDPELRTEGERLIGEIIAQGPHDIHTLWLLLDACDASPEIPGCACNHFGDRLIELVPDNVAVYLKAAGINVRLELTGAADYNVQDNKKNRQALLRASRAPHIDIYYSRDALELYRELEAFEEEFQPAHEPDIDLAPHTRASSHVWAVFTMLPLTMFGGLNDLCKAHVHGGRDRYVNACLKLARTMQVTGKTTITRALGYGLERKVTEAMGADRETLLYLFRKARMTAQASACFLSSWKKSDQPWPELDEPSILAFESDRGTLGEVAAFRNLAIRGYQANPEEYKHDPALCDQLMELDSESMGIVLGNADPKRLMESR